MDDRRPSAATPVLATVPPKPRSQITSGQVAILSCAIFLKGGLLGAYLPFSSLWLSEKGYGARQLALVALVDSIGCFALPVVGNIVDAFRMHNAGFIIILMILTVLKLSYLPAAGSILLILMLTALTAPLLRAANCILDTLTLYAFVERGNFARVRLMGDLGWGSFAMTVGLAMDYFHTEDVIYWLFAGACCLLSIMWCAASPYMAAIRPDSRQMSTTEFCSQVERLAREVVGWGTARAIFMVAVGGAASGLITTFELVLLKSMMGSGWLLGLAKLTGTIAALPVWWSIAPVMDRIGLRNVQLISMFFMSVRLYILGIINDPFQAVYSEALAGIGGFASMYGSITIFMGRVVDEDLKGTSQTIIFVFFSGFGAGFSPIAASYVVLAHGIKGMFLMASYVFAVVVAILALFDVVDWLCGTYRSLEKACELSLAKQETA